MVRNGCADWLIVVALANSARCGEVPAYVEALGVDQWDIYTVLDVESSAGCFDFFG